MQQDSQIDLPELYRMQASLKSDQRLLPAAQSVVGNEGCRKPGQR